MMNCISWNVVQKVEELFDRINEFGKTDSKALIIKYGALFIRELSFEDSCWVRKVSILSINRLLLLWVVYFYSKNRKVIILPKQQRSENKETKAKLKILTFIFCLSQNLRR